MTVHRVSRLRRIGIALLAFAGYGLVAAVVAAPVAAEQAMEHVTFEDRLGSLPVEVSLCHNGVSTVDTGVLGKLYWQRTGRAGFGAYIRTTGPPEAGGTLTSYVDPRFVETNAQFVSDPGAVATAYGEQLVAGFWERLLWIELLTFLVGGAVLLVLLGLPRGRSDGSQGARRGLALAVVSVLMATAMSGLLAGVLFQGWPCNREVTQSYAMPGVPQLAFSSRQTREVARQVQPFIEKNSERIQEKAAEYVDAAGDSLRGQLPLAVDELAPRAGERVVLAEADPQGSLVGTDVRAVLYPLLQQHLGDDAIALRTVSGDVSSNGTVAEKDFVTGEATVSGEIPTAAVKGDHDSEATVDQLKQNDVVVPHLEVVEVGGLRVAGANDPEFKSLFGGLVSNDTDLTETEVGEALREKVDEEPVIVLLHQPEAARAYLGLDSATALEAAEGRETRPWDDGVPDVPDGTVNIGHLHDSDGPWVLWNTDGELVTWTVVDQLGTSGGVEERPTFNRFSTPFSPPLKTLSVRLQYVDIESGLQTGYATVELDTDGEARIVQRVDVGLPGGQPLPKDEVGLG